MKRTCKLCSAEFDTKYYEVLCPSCRYRNCIICGAEFRLKAPYTKVTCSKACAGIYRKQSGISKSVAEKAKATMLGKYGVDNASKVSGPKQKKICKFCGKEFLPTHFGQEYCTDTHYGSCPICGKPVVITEYYKPAPCCSKECTQELRRRTCIDKYGSPYAVSSVHGLAKGRETCMLKYGVEHYSQTPQYKSRYVATMLKKYGVASPLQSSEIRAKWKCTNVAKYGVPYSVSSPSVRAKINATAEMHGGFGMQRPYVREKIEATNLQRYGHRNPLSVDSIRAKVDHTIKLRYGNISAMVMAAQPKRENTNLIRYGAKSPISNPTIKQKALDTLYDHYGVYNPMDVPELVLKSQENLKLAMLKKYGAPYSSNIPSIQQKMSETCLKRYGVPWFCMTEECAAHNPIRQSLPNNIFASRLDALGIEYTMEKRLGGKFYDICLSDQNTAIEIDPTYTHNSFGNHWNPDGMSPDYHLTKSNIAKENGYRCIHVFDWDDWGRVLALLKPKQTIYARNCEIREVDILSTIWFENHNHLQGSVRKQICRYGLYYNNELVQLMTFGAPRYNKNYEWELLRLCTHIDYRVVGGASKLFKHFIAECNPSSIISYCDKAKFTGDVYTAIGMRLDHVSTPAKHWSKSTEHITDNLLRQRGYDQLFGTEYGKGTSNEQLMLDNGRLPVYDCGQAVYVWHK